MTTTRESLERFLMAVLGSWTAFELASTHYGGNFRDAQRKQQLLLDSLVDAVLSDQYEVDDIAEFLNLYLFDEFSMELDDMSHVEVARVVLDGWSLIKQGVVPALPGRASGARASTFADNTEETSDVDDDTNMTDAPSQSHQPRIVTDEDGWSTVIPRGVNQ